MMGTDLLLIAFGVILSAIPLLLCRDIIIRYIFNNMTTTKCIKYDESLLMEDIKPFYNILKESVVVLEYIKSLPDNYSDSSKEDLENIIEEAKGALQMFDILMAQKKKKEERK